MKGGEVKNDQTVKFGSDLQIIETANTGEKLSACDFRDFDVTLKKTGKSWKRLSHTRWSTHFDPTNVVKENVQTIVSNLEDMQSKS